MNYKKPFLFGLCIIFTLCFLASTAIAYNIEGNGVCNCDTCADCTNALNDNTNCANEVKLTADITNHSGSCFFYPSLHTSISNIIFDGQNHTMDGDDTGYGFHLSNQYGWTIKNVNFTDWTSAIRNSGDHQNITIQDNTFTSCSGALGSIYLMNDCSGASILNNTFSNVAYTVINIIYDNNTDITVQDNTIENITQAATPLTVKGKTGILIKGNNISATSTGDPWVRGFLLTILEGIVEDNVIHDLSQGGWCRDHPAGQDSVIYRNNTFYNNWHGDIYLMGDGGTIQNNTMPNLDFSTGPPSGSNYLVRDNTLSIVELKGGINNTIIYNTITGFCPGWAGSYANTDAYGNNISHNTFTDGGAIQVQGTWRFYNNTISHNTFTTTNDYALYLNNADNNTIENNNVISSAGDAFQFTSNTADNKGCGNIGIISDSGTNYVSNTSQSCYIWGEENLDNTGRLACNKTYIVGIDFQPDYFSFRTSGLTLKDKNLNNMMFLQAYPSNASLNVTLTSWNSALKKYDEFGISTYLKYTINTSEVDKNYTVSIYAHSNDTKMQTFYIISNSSGYIAYNTSGFGYDRYTEIIPIAEPIPTVLIVSVIGAVAAGGAYVIRKWKKK